MTDAAYPFSSSLFTFYHCIIFPLEQMPHSHFTLEYLNDTLDKLPICPDKILNVAPLDEKWDQFQR